MKKVIAILLMATMVISFAACGSTNTAPEAKPEGTSTTAESNTGTKLADGEKNVLIAYFSATGTTKKIAEYAADSLNADLYEIKPAVPYTADDLNYNNDCRANIEMNDENCRPEISGSIENMADYDIVFIGYPIWWGKAPKILSTFMESYDFSGKTVVSFCTSGSSPNNDSAIQSLASGADWITGTRFAGNSTQGDVAEWINGLGLDIEAK